MQNHIKNIVGKISKGTYFDSHLIINQLYHDASSTEDYINYCAGKNIENAHSSLSKIIKSLPEVETVIIDKKEALSYSFNIHNKLSNCKLYKRL